MEGLNGNYRARALDMQLGTASTGTEQVAVEFELLDEPHVGMRVPWYGYFTDASAERTMESLRIAGWKSDDLTDKSGLGETEVSLKIGPEPYQGKTTTKVQFVNRLGGIAMKTPMVGDAAKAFAAKMKGLAVKSRQANGSKPAEPVTDSKTGKPLDF